MSLFYVLFYHPVYILLAFLNVKIWPRGCETGPVSKLAYVGNSNVKIIARSFYFSSL